MPLTLLWTVSISYASLPKDKSSSELATQGTERHLAEPVNSSIRFLQLTYWWTLDPLRVPGQLSISESWLILGGCCSCVPRGLGQKEETNQSPHGVKGS